MINLLRNAADFGRLLADELLIHLSGPPAVEVPTVVDVVGPWAHDSERPALAVVSQ